MKISPLRAALNEELSMNLGAKYNWMSVIDVVVHNRSNLSRSGLGEDVVTDVSGDLMLDIRSGKLSRSINHAHNSSKTEDELIDGLRRIVMKAAFFRASDAMKKKYRRGAMQFSQMKSDDDDDDFDVADVESDIQASEDVDYGQLLIDEFELMAVKAEWNHSGRLAKRYRKIKEIIPDRFDGMTMKDLMKKHGINSKGTFQHMINDIITVFSRVAEKLGDKKLVEGVERFQPRKKGFVNGVKVVS